MMPEMIKAQEQGVVLAADAARVITVKTTPDGWFVLTKVLMRPEGTKSAVIALSPDEVKKLADFFSRLTKGG